MLDTAIKNQLAAYLEKLQTPIELVASLDASDAARQMRELLADIAALSPKVSVREDGTDNRKPSFSVGRPGEAARIRFAGIPMGHEFTSLVLALLQTGGHPPKVDAAVIEQINGLTGNFRFETYISLSCHNCPDVVQALNLMAVLNPGIESVMIDGALYQDEVSARKIMAVPTVMLNGEAFGQGRMTIEEILAKVDTGATARAAEKLDARDAYDVLVVGGGPAGSAAAIYAARTGIRTGVVAERFGGQVLDTLSIENLISVPHTEGPKLAMALEQHVKEYEVDIMNLQRAEALVPAGDDGLAQVKLANGATLKAKSVILATGARWREMNVPGEKDYKGKGVCFCPHCDGPLFKGKRVAVIGGGNSGVEAAIDLAGIVSHVTLLEFDSKLRADAVLQAKLTSLPNVTIITSALTTEVTGNGEKVNGIVYQDRIGGQTKQVELEGIFVQIGLLPNTDWLKGTVKLSPRGEIEVDARGQTSLPGVFAAGDDGLARVQLANGATLKAKSVILATGARWREMIVPGEKDYKGKGVCFCPHCDGPLFKGKRVAVIGGGNSGVEAAIDLAGVVAHVTLLEFADDLRADAVLQKKLYSLPNVSVIKSAQTTEVTGADKVNGLVYKDRKTNAEHRLELEGIFVQIGLLPNTDFLRGTLELSRFGEVIVDAKGQTSVPGIFAAGDCTTVPYKQIIIAMGEGAKASLSAFDHLIRSSAPTM